MNKLRIVKSKGKDKILFILNDAMLLQSIEENIWPVGGSNP